MDHGTDTAERGLASSHTGVGLASDAGVVNAALRDRLAEIAAVNQLVLHLPTTEIRGHLAGVRSFLHDHVLRHAHAEERILLPALRQATSRPASATLGLTAEHDTLREATGTLDDLAGRALSAAVVGTLAGILDGTALLLEHHLDHETKASASLLDQLDPGQRDELLGQLASLDAPITATCRPWWLPEKLPREQTVGPADLLEPEGMVGASCDPGALAVARSATAAALEGVDAERWRLTLVEHSRYRAVIDTAERCMRDAGLWPWHPQHRAPCRLQRPLLGPPCQ